MSLVLATLPFVALGLLVGRLTILLVPTLAYCAYFGGLATGWWGAGLGDGWPFALAGLSAAGTFATAAGVALRRGYSHARSRAR